MIDLAGRTALVTGATGGLGQAIARRLAAEGMTLIVTGRRQDVLEQIASKIGGRAVHADLDTEEGLELVCGAAAEADVVVSNAGLPAAGQLTEFGIDQIRRALRVNLEAHVLLAHRAIPAMVGRGEGHLVFMSSMGGAKLVAPGLPVYAAAKAGLRGFSLALREDLRPCEIGVSAIYPGPISDAGMWADTEVPTPVGVKAKPPSAVAAAVVEAIKRNRAEVDVASAALRVATPLSLLWPEALMAMGRRVDSGRLVENMTEAHRQNR